MTEVYLSFLEGAITSDGSAHNRMSAEGKWTDHPAHGDWWGRAIQSLGTAAAHAPLAATRKRAARAFTKALRRTSPDLRARVFAALGAAEVLFVSPGNVRAARALEHLAATVPQASDARWPWPEPGLRYSNGAIPEALIASGFALLDAATLHRGLEMLDFLLDIEIVGGRLSPTGMGGHVPGGSRPQFDQQPIEVAALADACARAFDVTGDPHWLEGVHLAWEWFLGNNDSSTAMIDFVTGAGFDGLTPTGRNSNCGAESTLAGIRTAQQARRLLGVGNPA